MLSLPTNTMRRVLLLQTMGGQRKSYQDAAVRLGVDLLAYELPATSLSENAVASVVGFAKSNVVTGCVAADARAAAVGAAVTAALALPGHPAGAAGIARNKLLTRERLRDSDLLVPWFFPTSIGANTGALASMVAFPCVVKPLFSSNGRGVTRADDAPSFVHAFERLREQLASVDADADDGEHDTALVEGYVDGWEFVLVGVMHHGALHAFALIDKPDPLEGPLFEDTLYVVPSLHPRRCSGTSWMPSREPPRQSVCAMALSTPNAVSAIAACTSSALRRHRSMPHGPKRFASRRTPRARR